MYRSELTNDFSGDRRAGLPLSFFGNFQIEGPWPGGVIGSHQAD